MKTDAERDYEDMRRFQEAFIVADQKREYAEMRLASSATTNKTLKELCARAAEALEEWHKGTYPCRDLIAELRKAAE